MANYGKLHPNGFVTDISSVARPNFVEVKGLIPEMGPYKYKPDKTVEVVAKTSLSDLVAQLKLQPKKDLEDFLYYVAARSMLTNPALIAFWPAPITVI